MPENRLNSRCVFLVSGRWSVGDLRATAFRIQNFRNVDDSGWIELDRVTALVGRNESWEVRAPPGAPQIPPRI
jgi:hypothetical protein